MLKAVGALLALTVAIASCTTDDDAGNSGDALTSPPLYVALYFYDGDALLPEYRAIEPDMVRGSQSVMEALLAGPERADLTTEIEAGTELLEASETQDGLLFSFDERFWDGDRATVRRRAAQVVYTAAGLEDGAAVTLLDGLVPGTISDEAGDPLGPVIARDDFPAERPWIQVVQPVAGALVAPTFPVLAYGRRGTLTAALVAAGETIEELTLKEDGSGELDSSGLGGDVEVHFVLARDGEAHEVVVPVRALGA